MKIARPRTRRAVARIFILTIADFIFGFYGLVHFYKISSKLLCLVKGFFLTEEITLIAYRSIDIIL